MSKRFRADPYLERLATRVRWIEGDWLTVDETIVFAFAGGQQADRGTIGGHEVLASEVLDDGTIRYQLPPGHGLAAGDPVEQVIDGELRLRVMRIHTATHMAYAAMSEQMGEARELIGSNVHAGKGRIDWQLDDSVTPWVAAATERIAALVMLDLPVGRFADAEGSDRWMWELAGDDLDPTCWRMPCGGTHVVRTGEVGRVKLKRKNIGKGKERVEVTLLD